jgi:hypothetical protein
VLKLLPHVIQQLKLLLHREVHVAHEVRDLALVRVQQQVLMRRALRGIR